MQLEAFMKDRQWDAAAVASAVGVSPEAVRKWLRGERIPRPAQMRRIVEVTDGAVQPADFYTRPEAA
jgi:transcriptional regulator with XRE-family HTH domain